MAASIVKMIVMQVQHESVSTTNRKHRTNDSHRFKITVYRSHNNVLLIPDILERRLRHVLTLLIIC